MAINKELYERYKAMKAAAMNSASPSAQSVEPQPQPVTTSFAQPPVEPQPQPVTTSFAQPFVETQPQPVTTSFAQSSVEPQPQPVTTSFAQPPVEPQPQTVTTSFAQPSVETQSQMAEMSSNSAYGGTSTNHTENPDINSGVNQVQNSPSKEEKVKKFALIGYPLGHSLSKYIHDAGFESCGVQASYEILETKPEDLVDRIKFLRSNGYSGFNVTIPLKLPVTMFLDEIDASANIVNAINTVVINSENNFLKGYNTDAEGFRQALPKGISLAGKTAGILGTGGAARAAVCALAKERVKEIKFYTRNVANSLEFMEYLRKTYPTIEFGANQIDRIRDLSELNILVNATPIGMQGYAQGYTPVNEPELTTLPADAIVYDVIYNPKKTSLIKLAQKHNYKTVTGMDMLIYQAIEAQKIWTGKTPDFKDMKIAALENI